MVPPPSAQVFARRNGQSSLPRPRTRRGRGRLSAGRRSVWASRPADVAVALVRCHARALARARA
eukprot:7776297-Lingulodinium_polyedra.AAC.1